MPKRKPKASSEVTSKKIAERIASAISDLKGVDIRILDLRPLTSFTDYFVICSGTSSRHVQSISDRVLEDLRDAGRERLGVEGYDKGEWVLVDYGSVVAHIFMPATRTFYNIERLWGDARTTAYKEV